MSFTSLYDLLSNRGCDVGALAGRIESGQLHWHDDYGRLVLAEKLISEKALAALAKHYEMTQAARAPAISSKTTADNYSRWWSYIGDHGDDLAIVVRCGFVDGFEPKLQGAMKDLGARERHTLLVIIAALCSSSGLDPAGRHTVSKIVELTQVLGANVTDDTIRNVLGQIKDAVSNRTK